jgi:hypothetical protein
VFSLTVIVVGAAALEDAKAIGAWACRPRVTVRPPESEVVVRAMETCSPAAAAGDAGMAMTPTRSTGMSSDFTALFSTVK